MKNVPICSESPASPMHCTCEAVSVRLCRRSPGAILCQSVPVCFFSGHSHWATIKHDKANKDIKRSNLYAKLAKGISSAVQLGGADPGSVGDVK